MADDRVLFKRDVICDHYRLSTVLFYRLSKVKDSPIRKVAGIWCCNTDEMAEFVRRHPQKNRILKGRSVK